MTLIASLVLVSPVAAQAPVDSFEALRGVVEPGQPVVMVDREGHKQRGELVANSGQEITIKWRGAFFRSRQRTFSETETRQIEVADPPWEGALIGAGVGLAIVYWAEHTEDLGPGAIFLYYAPLLGPLVGGTIDRNMNRPVFVSPAAGAVMFVPVVGKGRIGASARFRF
jgi:hypothetical protein